MMTAGKTMRTLFQKYGARPSHSLPVHADDQAFFQAYSVGSIGSAIRLPLRISSISLRDVVNMTYSGAKYIKAKKARIR
jgi:hypothetical protein